MFQLDSKFSNVALDTLVADLKETKSPAADVANENRLRAVSGRPREDKIVWEDEDIYFVSDD